MAKLCPGQDTRFWRPEDIFEIPCASCGKPVEFFKDDVYRRCFRCGRRVENPKFSLGCAMWCEHAKACLGYDPAEAGLKGNGGEALVDRALEALGKEIGPNTPGFSFAVRAAEFARELVGPLNADPRVVLLAALVAGEIRARGQAWAGDFLEAAGVHWSVAGRAAALAASLSADAPPETAEDRALRDAVSLAGMAAGGVPPELLTAPGLRIAKRLNRPITPENQHLGVNS